MAGCAPVAGAHAAQVAQPSELAVRASYGGAPSHPVALSRALLPRVGRLRGDEGARRLLSQANVRLVELDQLAPPRDVDTPEDLERLRTAGTRPS